MVGTATVTYAQTSRGMSAHIAWLSDASGDVNGNDNVNLPDGTIELVEFDPDGTDVPTAAYDVTLLTSTDQNVLSTLGDNLSATVATSAHAELNIEKGAYDLKVAAAGAAKRGTVTIHVRRSERHRFN